MAPGGSSPTISSAWSATWAYTQPPRPPDETAKGGGCAAAGRNHQGRSSDPPLGL